MANEESFLGLAETGTDNREETGDGVEEDGTATSGVKVERVRKPATAVEETSTKESLEDKLGRTYHRAETFTKPTSRGGNTKLGGGGTRVTVGFEKEAVECFRDLQGGSISDIHSCSHLHQDGIEFIARTQALDAPLHRKTIDGTPASTILPLLRLLTKSHLPTTPAKAIRLRTLADRPHHGIRIEISPYGPI